MKKQFFLILLSPLLLSFGWAPLPLGVLLFAGFIPLLMLEQIAIKKYWLKVYLSIILWNLATTFWVWNASPGGCIAMLICNSLLQLIPFIIYKRIKKNYSINFALIAWAISMLSVEYLHLNWQIAYPWLNLGNGLAGTPQIIQWYEYTGTFGGSLWILLINIFIFKYFNSRDKINIYVSSFLVIVPIIFSFIILYSISLEKKGEIKIAVIQPNIDPYTKFDNYDPESEVNNFIKMSENVVDSSIEFLLFPETGLTQNCNEENINDASTYTMLKTWINKYPDLTLVSGCNTHRFFDSAHRTSTSRKYNENRFYDVYNSSVAVNKNGVIDIYHKSKLVPGVEKMPYPKIFGFLEKMAIDLGGTSGSLGEDSVQKVFFSKKNIGAAPIICYESIFGELTGNFVKNGAKVIFVLTNDGWWGNTPGYRQHEYYARLRAIEYRRDVVRCTNTGVSCKINKKGEISGETLWWKPDAVVYDVNPSSHITFYSLYGDFIGRTAAWLMIVVFFMLIFKKENFKKFLFYFYR